MDFIKRIIAEAEDTGSSDMNTLDNQNVTQNVDNQEEDKIEESSEIFNVYVTTLPTAWRKSKFEKDGHVTNFRTVEFKKTTGGNFTFYHNIHEEPRAGGVNKELLNQFDAILRAAAKRITSGSNKILVKNVKYYRYFMDGATKGRYWIMPTSNTELFVIQTKPVTKVLHKLVI